MKNWLFAFLLCSCSPIPMVMRADFQVSKIEGIDTTCVKQNCLIFVAKDGISLLSEGYDITVNEQVNIPEQYLMGNDQLGHFWRISIGNLKDEPFILLMKV